VQGGKSFIREIPLFPFCHACMHCDYSLFAFVCFSQNFPLLKRLKTLLLSNNLIFRVGDDLKDSLPNVHTIMLANNSLLNLSDLKPFANLPALRRLVLSDNNVTKQVRVFYAEVSCKYFFKTHETYVRISFNRISLFFACCAYFWRHTTHA